MSCDKSITNFDRGRTAVEQALSGRGYTAVLGLGFG